MSKVIKLRYRLVIYAGLISLVAVIFHTQVLTGLAMLWVVNDHPVKADAIVVLGGNGPNRAIEAAHLFHSGYAPRILITRVEPGVPQRLGLIPMETDITRKMLQRNGVSERSIAAIGHHVSSTYDEAMALRDWVNENQATNIIIVTDLFHTRRVCWFIAKQLRGTTARIIVVAHDYGRCLDWWTNEECLIGFQNEMVKTVYYWMRY